MDIGKRASSQGDAVEANLASGGGGPGEEERVQAGKLVSTLLERQREMTSSDPFEMLKELTSSFGLKNQSTDKREQYNQFQQQFAIPGSGRGRHNFGSTIGDTSSAGKGTEEKGPYTASGGNSLSMPPGLNIKHKELFMKAQNANKPTDWFSKYQKSKEDALNPPGLFNLPDLQESQTEKKKMQIGITKEDKIKIGLEMIPMFQAKEEELTQVHNKIKNLKDQLKQFKHEQGIKIRYAQPQHTTSFMNRKGSSYIKKNRDTGTSGMTSKEETIEKPGESLSATRSKTTSMINHYKNPSNFRDARSNSSKKNELLNSAGAMRKTTGLLSQPAAEMPKSLSKATPIDERGESTLTQEVYGYENIQIANKENERPYNKFIRDRSVSVERSQESSVVRTPRDNQTPNIRERNNVMRNSGQNQTDVNLNLTAQAKNKFVHVVSQYDSKSRLKSAVPIQNTSKSTKNKEALNVRLQKHGSTSIKQSAATSRHHQPYNGSRDTSPLLDKRKDRESTARSNQTKQNCLTLMIKPAGHMVEKVYCKGENSVQSSKQTRVKLSSKNSTNRRLQIPNITVKEYDEKPEMTKTGSQQMLKERQSVQVALTQKVIKPQKALYSSRPISIKNKGNDLTYSSSFVSQNVKTPSETPARTHTQAGLTALGPLKGVSKDEQKSKSKHSRRKRNAILEHNLSRQSSHNKIIEQFNHGAERRKLAELNSFMQAHSDVNNVISSLDKRSNSVSSSKVKAIQFRKDNSRNQDLMQSKDLKNGSVQNLPTGSFMKRNMSREDCDGTKYKKQNKHNKLSKRDLMELIFVDKQVFVTDIGFLKDKKKTKSKSNANPHLKDDLNRQNSKLQKQHGSSLKRDCRKIDQPKEPVSKSHNHSFVEVPNGKKDLETTQFATQPSNQHQLSQEGQEQTGGVASNERELRARFKSKRRKQKSKKDQSAREMLGEDVIVVGSMKQREVQHHNIAKMAKEQQQQSNNFSFTRLDVAATQQVQSGRANPSASNFTQDYSSTQQATTTEGPVSRGSSIGLKKHQMMRRQRLTKDMQQAQQSAAVALSNSLTKLEKLERKIQRRQRRKTLGEVEQDGESQTGFAKSKKKNRKNWRFAYDMYCKELIQGTVQSPKNREPTSAQIAAQLVDNKQSTGVVSQQKYKQVCQTLMNQTTTYVRHTNTKSMSKKDLKPYHVNSSQYQESPRRYNLSSRCKDDSQAVSRRRLKTASDDQGSRIKISSSRQMNMQRIGTSGSHSRPVISRESGAESQIKRNFDSVDASYNTNPAILPASVPISENQKSMSGHHHSIRSKLNGANSLEYPQPLNQPSINPDMEQAEKTDKIMINNEEYFCEQKQDYRNLNQPSIDSRQTQQDFVKKGDTLFQNSLEYSIEQMNKMCNESTLLSNGQTKNDSRLNTRMESSLEKQSSHRR